jgi:hypothetical protein
MAAAGAAPSRGIGLEFQWYLPPSKRKRLRDVMVLLAGMDIVACPAAAAAGGLVDMQVVEVPVPVPKTCVRARAPHGSQTLVVAAEAKSIGFSLEGSVEISRVPFREQGKIRTSMRLMAASAVPVRHRSVVLWIGSQLGLKILVATQTKLVFGLVQQSGLRRHMGVVAAAAGSLGLQRGVFDRDLLGSADHILMASAANLKGGPRQHLGKTATVWIVTRDTALLGRRVDRSRGSGGCVCRDYGVALSTQLGLGGTEKLSERRAVGFMA